jgi:hypothetical protein
MHDRNEEKSVSGSLIPISDEQAKLGQEILKPTFPGFPARRARFFVSSRHTATKFGRNQPRWQPNRPVSCLAGPKLVAWPSSRHTSAVVVCCI